MPFWAKINHFTCKPCSDQAQKKMKLENSLAQFFDARSPTIFYQRACAGWGYRAVTGEFQYGDADRGCDLELKTHFKPDNVTPFR